MLDALSQRSTDVIITVHPSSRLAHIRRLDRPAETSKRSLPRTNHLHGTAQPRAASHCRLTPLRHWIAKRASRCISFCLERPLAKTLAFIPAVYLIAPRLRRFPSRLQATTYWNAQEKLAANH